MLESPPKRVTRSRAKASGNTDVHTSASSASTTRTAAKRRLRNEDSAEGTGNDINDAVAEQQAPKPTRGRPRKAPVRASRQTLPESQTEATSNVESVPPVKAQPRRPAVSTKTNATPTQPAIAPAKRATRQTAVPTTSLSSPPQPRRMGPKKRVTFQVDDDKENQTPQEPITSRISSKTSLLKSKPVRRPAGTKAGTRRVTRSAPNDAQPLSPKKPNQLPAANEVHNEDQFLDRSPIKPPSAKRRQEEPNNDITNMQSDPTEGDPLAADSTASPIKSPAKAFSSSLLSSPAKKISLFRPGSASTSHSPSKSRAEHTTSLAAPLFRTSLLSSPAKRPSNSPSKRQAVVVAQMKETVTASLEEDPFNVSKADSPSEKTPVFSFPDQFDQEQIPDFSFPKDVSPAKSISPSKTLFTNEPLQSPAAQLSSPSPKDIVIDDFADDNPSQDILNEDSVIRGTVFEDLQAVDMDVDTEEFLQPHQLSPVAEEDTLAELDDLEEVDFAVEQKAFPSPAKNEESGFSKFVRPGNLFAGLLAKRDSDITVSDKAPVIAIPESSLAPRYTTTHPSDIQDMDELEDELTMALPSIQLSPSKSKSNRQESYGSTSIYLQDTSSDFVQRDIVSMTPLVFRFGSMGLMSPSKKGLGKSKRESILSPIPPAAFYGNQTEPEHLESPDATTTNDENALPVQIDELEAVESIPEGGFENPVFEPSTEEHPEDDFMEDIESDKENQPIPYFAPSTETKLQPVISTPIRAPIRGPREFYSVQKIPLKPAGELSPVKIQRKRRGSISGPSNCQDHRTGLSRSKTVISYSPEQRRPIMTDDILEDICEPVTPVQSRSMAQDTFIAETPLVSYPNTPAQIVDSTILNGVVAYVDVHTAEGADASGVFIDLLTQMGAKCVKQWNWNGASSVRGTPAHEKGFGLGGSDEGIYDPGLLATPGGTSQGNSRSGSKIGVTHVIFKDGGVRTLEKVREAAGIVTCVNVAWVLE
jgi:hypothetical protein